MNSDDSPGEPEEVWTIFQTQQKASFMNRHGLYLSCDASGTDTLTCQPTYSCSLLRTDVLCVLRRTKRRAEGEW
jgi:hypothetical protein